MSSERKPTPGRADPAIAFRDGDAEQPLRAHLAEDLRIGMLLRERLAHARLELLLGIGAGGVADGSLQSQ